MSSSSDNALLIHAAAEARRFLEKYGVTSPGDIVLEDMAYGEGVEVKHGPLPGAEALLIRVEGVGTIKVSDKLESRGLQRFAIAHELGHWCLHRAVRQEFFCSAEHMREYRNSGVELEANTFAGELLMPRHMIRRQLFEGEPRWQAIEEIVETFQVAPISAAIRYAELVRQPVIAVFSDGRNVHWWRENRSKTDGLWLESQQSLATDSLAYHCNSGISDSSFLEQVPWDAWFPHIRVGEDQELFELAVPLDEKGTLLSLLWIPGWTS